jgi:hypothetical protein
MSKVNPTSVRVLSIAVLILASTGLSQLAVHAQPVKPVTESQAVEETPKDAATILASARTIFVHSRTGLVKSEVIESELQKRDDFQRSGLLLTKDPKAADLMIEVRRANFTTEYPYVAIDSKTKLIVASGRVNSLFGTAAGKIAKGFMKQLERARTPLGLKTKK